MSKYEHIQMMIGCSFFTTGDIVEIITSFARARVFVIDHQGRKQGGYVDNIPFICMLYLLHID